MINNEHLTDQLVPELSSIVEKINDRGISVYAYCDGTPAPGTWVALERDGNVGSLQYDSLTGYGVFFAIKPSIDLGSALRVTRPDGQDIVSVDDVLDAVVTATGPSYYNFTMTPMKNHGWDHFAVFKNALVKLTEPAVTT